MRRMEWEGLTREGSRQLTQGRQMEQIRRIADEYKVSERTARRYLKRGEIPARFSDRRIGSDGKTYPATNPQHGARSVTPMKRNLALAYQAIMRVDRKSQADGFYQEDLADLRRICDEAMAMLADWKRGIEEGKERTG